jgi:creatinine amidohydrolase
MPKSAPSNPGAGGSVFLRQLTRREFRERFASGELQAAIVPVAAIEQHLEHLAIEHDWRSVVTVAERIAERLRPRVLVAEGVMAGVSEHHMRHPGTLTLRPGTFLAVLDDLISSVVRAGFRNVLVLNGHGGNIAPIAGVWEQLLREFQVNLHFLSYWDVLGEEDAELLRGGRRLPHDLPGHAQEFETSIALAAFPENVREAARADQTDPHPALAEAATGRAFLERIVERVAAYVEEMIDGGCEAEVPPFFP